eukprot:3237798-Rhodomonas_salina.1
MRFSPPSFNEVNIHHPSQGNPCLVPALLPLPGPLRCLPHHCVMTPLICEIITVIAAAAAPLLSVGRGNSIAPCSKDASASGAAAAEGGIALSMFGWIGGRGRTARRFVTTDVT